MEQNKPDWKVALQAILSEVAPWALGNGLLDKSWQQKLKAFGVSVLSRGLGEAEETTNPPDVAKMDIPLFIRLLEYAKEEALTDMDLHEVATNVTRLARGGQTLNMEHYTSIIPQHKQRKAEEPPKPKATPVPQAPIKPKAPVKQVPPRK